jgi:hypothetical protein
MTDPLQEWFPALADRHSATTLQGLEWTLGGKFYSRWDELSALQSCCDVACVDDMTSQPGIEYDYVILDMSQTVSELSIPFLEEGYVQVYGNGQYVVLGR